MRKLSEGSASPVADAGRGPFSLRWPLVGGFLVSLLVLASSWHLPILEAHAFRQTQTAISSYWMSTTANWLAYPTPVLGAPWSIPFEFPLFQAIVLSTSSALPLNLDQAGRLISWLFALATLVPLRHCLRQITGKERLADTVCLIFLLSPLYLFWSRTFMIESTALFFSVAFLALAVEYWHSPRRAVLVAMFVAACLGALIKITTFFGLGFATALFLLSRFYVERRSDGVVQLLRRSLPIAGAVFVALLMTAAWIHYGDVQKSKTIWGHLLTSQNLATWNYGNWEQKTSSVYWHHVVFGRAPRELLGSQFVLPIMLGLVAVFGRGIRVLTGMLLLAYLVPFFMFANLHSVHNYYQYANGVFLLAVAACGIEALRTTWDDKLAFVATGVMVAFLLFGFKRDFLPLFDRSLLNPQSQALATFARRNTAPDEVILGFGMQWSSEVPYYATRRAMLVIDSIPLEDLARMRKDPASYSGAFPVGLVIVCPNPISSRADVAAEYEALLRVTEMNRKRFRVGGCDVYK